MLWGPPAFMSPTSSPMTAASLDRRAVVITGVPSVCAYSAHHQMAGHHGPWSFHPPSLLVLICLFLGQCISNSKCEILVRPLTSTLNSTVIWSSSGCLQNALHNIHATTSCSSFCCFAVAAAYHSRCETPKPQTEKP